VCDKDLCATSKAEIAGTYHEGPVEVQECCAACTWGHNSDCPAPGRSSALVCAVGPAWNQYVRGRQTTPCFIADREIKLHVAALEPTVLPYLLMATGVAVLLIMVAVSCGLKSVTQCACRGPLPLVFQCWAKPGCMHLFCDSGRTLELSPGAFSPSAYRNQNACLF
jgi:hypothetical protein